MNALKPNEKKRSTWAPVGLWLLAGLMGGVLGFAVAVVVLGTGGGTQEQVSPTPDNRAAVDDLLGQVQELQTLLDATRELPDTAGEPPTNTHQVEELRADVAVALERESFALGALSVAQTELDLASAEQAGLRAELRANQSRAAEESARLDTLQEMYDSLERHRLLLLELRRENPADREESLTYWNNVQDVATRANPALTSPVEKVLVRVDNYYDWKDNSPDPSESVDEYLDWREAYDTSGAIAYDEATVTFNRQALLSVVNRMDTLLSQLER